MPGGGYSQPFGLFGKRDCLPLNCGALLAKVSITPEEVTTQFVHVLADLLGEKRGLHGIYRDRGDRSFDEGGPGSH